MAGVEIRAARASSDLLCCPCNMKTSGVRTNSVTIICCKCCVRWHTKCIGLNGMTSKEAVKFTEWNCPRCFTFPNNEDYDDNKTLQEQVTAEVMNVLPLLVTTVVQQTECHVNRSYASVTKESQESFVKKCIEESSSIAVEKGLRKIEDDIADKERRKRNIIIRNVSESVEESSSNRSKSDRRMVERILGVIDSDPSTEIINVIRLGGKKDKDGNLKTFPRPLLVSLASSETAEFYHDYGRGFKTNDGYWINPDLSKTQREANFRARQQRRESKNLKTNE